MRFSIHCQPAIGWHLPWAKAFLEGLASVGLKASATSEMVRTDGIPILFGTTWWRNIESDGGPFLLVDRCSFGDASQWVQLVWNGHGRRGDHRVPENHSAIRWERHGISLEPWRDGERIILCGQTETYSPVWPDLLEWYGSVPATHFRPHPMGSNPTELPIALQWSNCRMAITLNSSVAVEAVIKGIPTVTMDGGAMAWDVCGHQADEYVKSDRLPWCHWLAWTQWSKDEVRAGTPWAYLLP